jgi:hypothetical protein
MTLVEGVVGFAIGGFDLRERRGGFGWAVLEKAVRQRSTYALMEEHKHQGRADSLVSEAMGVMVTVAFEQPVTLHLA